MKPLRIGVIGTGSIATGAHLPAIAKLGGLLELVAVADVRGEVARSVGASYGVEAYDDYRQLLDRDDIDLVDICTPEFLEMRSRRSRRRQPENMSIAKNRWPRQWRRRMR